MCTHIWERLRNVQANLSSCGLYVYFNSLESEWARSLFSFIRSSRWYKKASNARENILHQHLLSHRMSAQVLEVIMSYVKHDVEWGFCGTKLDRFQATFCIPSSFQLLCHFYRRVIVFFGLLHPLDGWSIQRTWFPSFTTYIYRPLALYLSTC